MGGKKPVIEKNAFTDRIQVECPDCKILCKYIGGTVGGTQLYGCPQCRVVYFLTRDDKGR
jgi:phage FluMu protein Com